MKKNSITIGFLQGACSLIGVDIEFLSNRYGLQFGVGYIGYGLGFNYHFKPSVRSSFISLNYWNQGIGKSFVQNAIGTTFVYRGKKWFTAQLGLGIPLKRGPAFPSGREQPQVMLLYSIGGYIPI